MNKILLALSLVLLTLTPTGPVTATEAVPVVIAVDTSRSLRAGDLTTIRSCFAETLRRLPVGAAVGLIGFDDEARWLRTPGADHEAVVTALNETQPAGNFTVLHDALFLAARALTEGGVIVVVSDGRDENSATTVDDVARLCEGQQVRILTAGVGRQADDRALRRFALLSRGEHLGDLAAVSPDDLAAAIERARRNIVAERAEAAATAPIAAQQPAEAVAAAAAEPEDTARLPLWVYGLGVIAALAAMLLIALVLLRRRTTRPELRVCTRCGANLEPWESSCSQCEIAQLEKDTTGHPVAAAAQQVAVSSLPDESVLDPAVFEKAPMPAGLDQTIVLDEQPVLIARERGRPPRSYALPRNEIFVVGRAPDINTLQLDDPTVSAQHFKVVPKGNDFYVVDLGTTNGTAVNHDRIKVHKLQAGDIIRVGMVELEFKMKVQRLV